VSERHMLSFHFSHQQHPRENFVVRLFPPTIALHTHTQSSATASTVRYVFVFDS
jgi:hypothetical protein